MILTVNLVLDGLTASNLITEYGTLWVAPGQPPAIGAILVNPTWKLQSLGDQGETLLKRKGGGEAPPAMP